MKRCTAFSTAVVFCVCWTAAGQSAAEPRSRTTVSRSASAGEMRQILVTAASPGGTSPGPEVSIVIPLQFRLNSAELTAEARGLLERLAEALRDESLAGRRHRIEGHTDSSGAAAYNLKLSQRRAESVYDFLVLRGIPVGRLDAQGFGETRPLPGMSPEDPRNRRVEIVRLP